MIAGALSFAARLLTGVTVWPAVPVPGPQRIYFANHTSHLDFLAIWSVLAPAERATVRPIAARDYWQRGLLRPWLADRVFRAVLVERTLSSAHDNPLAPALDALRDGSSLILFPEGTRSVDGAVGPFKAGLHALAARFPEVELVPVFVENLNRVLPKGEFLPVPFVCRVAFGGSMRLEPGEPKKAFLARTREAVCTLNAERTD